MASTGMTTGQWMPLRDGCISHRETFGNGIAELDGGKLVESDLAGPDDELTGQDDELAMMVKSYPWAAGSPLRGQPGAAMRIADSERLASQGGHPESGRTDLVAVDNDHSGAHLCRSQIARQGGTGALDANNGNKTGHVAKFSPLPRSHRPAHGDMSKDLHPLGDWAESNETTPSHWQERNAVWIPSPPLDGERLSLPSSPDGKRPSISIDEVEDQLEIVLGPMREHNKQKDRPVFHLGSNLGLKNFDMGTSLRRKQMMTRLQKIRKELQDVGRPSQQGQQGGSAAASLHAEAQLM